MNVRACYITNTGKVRTANEDSMLLQDLVISGRSMEEQACIELSGDRFLFMVADGMGGHARGEVASRVVLEVFRDFLGSMEDAGDIQEAADEAKLRLNTIAQDEYAARGLGTTIAGVFFNRAKAIIFNCGDSRVYGLKGPSLERMTRDHSLVQELVDSGVITEEEMRSHPQKNIVTSAVIGDMKSGVKELFIREMDLAGPGRFLLCTDGLWESMDRSDIEKCLARPELRGAAGCLFAKAMTTARDNVSIIALDVTA